MNRITTALVATGAAVVGALVNGIYETHRARRTELERRVRKLEHKTDPARRPYRSEDPVKISRWG